MSDNTNNKRIYTIWHVTAYVISVASVLAIDAHIECDHRSNRRWYWYRYTDQRETEVQGRDTRRTNAGDWQKGSECRIQRICDRSADTLHAEPLYPSSNRGDEWGGSR